MTAATIQVDCATCHGTGVIAHQGPGITYGVCPSCHGARLAASATALGAAPDAPVATRTGAAHYPSFGELAAFRRRLRLALPPEQRFARNHPDEHHVGPHASHAWADELRHGIGWSVGKDWFEATDERAQAAAIRARAFETLHLRLESVEYGLHPAMVQAIGSRPVSPGDSDFVAAWWEEREQGCPPWGALVWVARP
mgnify:CR=1 FL=1